MGLCYAIMALTKKKYLAFSSYLDTFWKVYVHVEPIQINCKCNNHNKNVNITFCFGIEKFKKVQYFYHTLVSKKVLSIYKDSKIQQHWIYEMKDLLPFFLNASIKCC